MPSSRSLHTLHYVYNDHHITVCYLPQWWSDISNWAKNRKGFRHFLIFLPESPYLEITLLQFYFLQLLITHSLVLLSVPPHTQHSHSVMTLISLSHSLSLSNPLLSSLAQWLLCCSSVALSYPFLIGRVCACGVPFSVWVCVFSPWLERARCWFSASSRLNHQRSSHTLLNTRNYIHNQETAALYTIYKELV